MPVCLSPRKVSDASASLCSLPDDILRRIILEITRGLSFQERCSLELVDKSFHAVISNPLPSDGMWGTCDLMSDLKLDNNFGRKEDILR